ncbi:MAG: hypothetical protein ACRDU8_11100 [Egibacteraceae bacterium]
MSVLDQIADSAAKPEYALSRRDVSELGERPCPETALRSACDRLRARLPEGARPYDLLAACGGVEADPLPTDDAELWLTVAAGVVEPQQEPPEGYASALVAAWYALDHADWLCAVVELARRGSGAPAEASDLAAYVDASDLAEGELELDDVDGIAFGFLQVVELWRALEAIDGDDRLTPLGWWGLPEAQRRVWVARES